MPNPNWDTLLSTTMNNYRGKLEDNVFTSRPFINWLFKKNRVHRSAGAKIIVPLIHAVNSTAGSFSGYDTLSLTPQDGISAAEYAWKQFSVQVAISGIEEDKNYGDEQAIDLLEAKIMQAEESAAEKLDQQLIQGDGTGNSNKDWDGLALQISTTSVTGGIDPAVSGSEYWKSVVPTVSPSSVRSTKRWVNAYNSAASGNNKPDFGMTTQVLFEDYEASLAPQLRFSSNDSASGTFENLLFKKIPMFYDTYVPTGVTYFLNSKHIGVEANKRTWARHTPFVRPADKDARYSSIFWTGNLTVNNRSRHAKVTNEVPA